VYLRRRRLNIQDEELSNFNSDEEEEKVVSEINRELELLSPEDAAADLEENKERNDRLEDGVNKELES